LESPGESSSRAGDVDGYVRTVGRERQDLIAAWMSGYFNAARNQSVLNLARFDRNRKAIEVYYKTHKPETLMSAIQRNAY
jgi:hypothetical protein